MIGPAILGGNRLRGVPNLCAGVLLVSHPPRGNCSRLAMDSSMFCFFIFSGLWNRRQPYSSRAWGRVVGRRFRGYTSSVTIVSYVGVGEPQTAVLF